MSRPDPDALGAALGRVLPTPVTVEHLERVSGGASRETWLFDAADGDGTRHRLVLRRDPGGYAGQTERATEYLHDASGHRLHQYGFGSLQHEAHLLFGRQRPPGLHPLGGGLGEIGGHDLGRASLGPGDREQSLHQATEAAGFLDRGIDLRGQ